MKKILAILILFITYNGFAQSWDPYSAYWIYGASYYSSGAQIRLSYLRDTLINGQDCQILKRDVLEYDYYSKTYSYRVWDNEVTYYKSGVTYILNDNKFDTLYYFAANINDRYKITSKLSWRSKENAYAVVVDTGHTVINQNKLKWLAVDYKFKSDGFDVDYYTLRDTIIERIGATKLYYLPWDVINGMLDGNEGGELQCYHDYLIGVYNNNKYNYGDCNFDISLGIPSIESNLVNVFPNPADSEFSITLKNKQVENILSIYTTSGQIVKSIRSNFSNDVIKINTSSWSNGLYILIVSNKSGSQKEKIIVSHCNSKIPANKF
jgi:hypothetical protein